MLFLSLGRDWDSDWLEIAVFHLEASLSLLFIDVLVHFEGYKKTEDDSSEIRVSWFLTDLNLLLKHVCEYEATEAWDQILCF